jgi:hypothetical protein
LQVLSGLRCRMGRWSGWPQSGGSSKAGILTNGETFGAPAGMLLSVRRYWEAEQALL